jgi:AmmeMemoRadiSam system protein B
MADERPRLVSLEPHQVQLSDGSTAIALRDPLGILEGAAVVSPAAYWVLAHLDGSRTVPEVVGALAAAGIRAARADVEHVVRQALEAGLVHGDAYERRRVKVLAAYRAGPRPPACAGGAYPDDPRELSELLDGFFSHPDGPGPRGGAPGRGVRLLVAPHIDFHRGGPGYAHAYGALHGCEADLYVVLGTAHASPPHLFTLTRQDFATPLGDVPVDRAVADALLAELGEEELLSDELAHVGEHSVEFQVVWLRWLLGARPFAVLPVLCSSISHLADPAAATRPFLAALARATGGRRVCFVAGADLAHAGPQYGDDAAVSRESLDALGREDRRTLAYLGSGDADGFHRDAIVDDARRRLCGVAPIYAAMRAAGRGARLLHHGQWWDGTDTVSFCAAAG